MKNILQKGLIAISLSAIFIGCGPSSYNGKVDVVGIGAGAKPKPTNPQYVNQADLKYAKALYADEIIAKEQDVSDNVKYIAGDALIVEYSGKPAILVDYLNAYQKLENLALILDKNGVVAWQGYFKVSDIDKASGTYDYGITGSDNLSFKDAMEKFVGDEEEAEDYDKDKKISFPKNNKESFLAGFSYSKKYPFLFTKLSNMKLKTSDGKVVDLDKYMKNGKPSVLIFYMASTNNNPSLMKDVDKVANVVNFFQNKDVDEKLPKPEYILKEIEKRYLQKEK